MIVHSETINQKEKGYLNEIYAIFMLYKDLRKEKRFEIRHLPFNSYYDIKLSFLNNFSESIKIEVKSCFFQKKKYLSNGNIRNIKGRFSINELQLIKGKNDLFCFISFAFDNFYKRTHIFIESKEIIKYFQNHKGKANKISFQKILKLSNEGKLNIYKNIVKIPIINQNI